MRVQSDLLIQRLAFHWGVSIAAVALIVDRTREEIKHQQGTSPSLGNTFAALGIPIPVSVQWRLEVMDPERFLQPDPDLYQMLRGLAGRFRIGSITNNPEEIGRRTLAALGVASCMEVVVGLDTTMESKPSWAPFQAALDALGAAPAGTVVVGDRYDVDLAPIIQRGGCGILIESRQDLSLVVDALS